VQAMTTRPITLQATGWRRVPGALRHNGTERRRPIRGRSQGGR
jgi:hypothetical protein